MRCCQRMSPLLIKQSESRYCVAHCLVSNNMTLLSVSGPSVTVIIPALNAEKYIAPCLTSLVAQTLPRDRFEVIVVDNGSSDATIRTSLSFVNTLDLKVIRREKVYISAVRNFGAWHARGNILAFLDADCVAPPNWLVDATQLLSRSEYGIVGAHYNIPPHSSWSAYTWDRYLAATKHGNVPFVPAGDLLMTHEIFDRLGGFDETIQTNEDVELCRRVWRAGLSVHADPNIAVTHFGTPQTLKSFYNKERWHGMHVFRVFLRDFPASGNERVVLFAFYILVCEVGIVAGLLLGFLADSWWLFLLAVIMVLLPAILLSCSGVISSKRWADFFRLGLLYLTYGAARARCLLDLKSWSVSS